MEAKREAARDHELQSLTIDEAAVAELLLEDARESLVASRAAVDLLEQRMKGRVD